MGIHEKNLEKPCDCNCKGENTKSRSKEDKGKLFSPLKGKMKVLKKIKRRMGLASRSSSNGGGTNNLPPLLFHNVHGENVRISRDGTVAKRAESFCKGIAFSSRQVKVNEKIYIKFLEISINWSGVIRFGFTYNDPSSLRSSCLPKYACPDLTNKPGYWAKALPERFCSRNTVLFYYVTSAGDVHFGINGEDKGVFFSGVDTRGPLWALIDIYGNSTAIEFVDVRHNLNSSVTSASCRRSIIANNNYDVNEEIIDNSNVDRLIYPMQQCNIQTRDNEDVNLPHLAYQQSHGAFQPAVLHRTCGRNVRFNASRTVAARVDNEFCQGYVFTSRPLQIGERVVVQILSTEAVFQGHLAIGFTSCDPATLQTADLPNDSHFLLDRPEYWVISREFPRTLKPGDEISFCIRLDGKVEISRNGGAPLVVIHVDQTLRLWAFFDIFGSTQKIRVLTAQQLNPQIIQQNNNRTVALSTSQSVSESINSLNQQSELRNSRINNNSNNNLVQSQNGARILAATSAASVGEIFVHPNLNGGAAVLVSALSSQIHSSHLNNLSPLVHQVVSSCSGVSHGGAHASQLSPSKNSNLVPNLATNTGTMMSSCSSNYIEPIPSVDSGKYSTTPVAALGMGWLEQNSGNVPGAGTECTICYENPIDAVLYMCGHMCMCYECALQQWKGKGGGHCPLCRATIRDVIRTYKS